MFHGEFHEKFRGYHWIYVPDKDIPFYRLGIYSHIPNNAFQKDQTALYIEQAYSCKEFRPVSLDIEIREILTSLDRLKWVCGRNLVVMSAHWIDYAYVHFDHARHEIVENIKRTLKSYDVQVIGRYGLWDYISMEDSICSGLEAAQKALG